MNLTWSMLVSAIKALGEISLNGSVYKYCVSVNKNCGEIIKENGVDSKTVVEFGSLEAIELHKLFDSQFTVVDYPQCKSFIEHALNVETITFNRGGVLFRSFSTITNGAIHAVSDTHNILVVFNKDKVAYLSSGTPSEFSEIVEVLYSYLL